MYKAEFRFYEELNDFLPKKSREVKFTHMFIDRTSVKDMIASFGVPHQEIDLILVNGISVDFSYIVKDGDQISVYPVFESFDITGLTRLRPAPLRNLKFIADVHLGKLARYMRMLGFDTAYENSLNDDEIVRISIEEKRTILTKDKGILKRNIVTHGYWVRNIEITGQLNEIIKRFDLQNNIKSFSRCMICNRLLTKVEKDEVFEHLPDKTRRLYSDFFYCSKCNKYYWKGTHYSNMKEFFCNKLQIYI